MFSLGAVTHILLLGKSVFKGKDFEEVVIKNRDCKI